MVLMPRFPNISAHFLGHAHACPCTQADMHTRMHLGFVAKRAESKTPSLSSALHVGDGAIVTVMTPQRCSRVEKPRAASLLVNTRVRCVCTPAHGAGRRCGDRSPMQRLNTALTTALKCLPSSSPCVYPRVSPAAPQGVHPARWPQREWPAAWALGRAPGLTPAPPAGHTDRPSSVWGRTRCQPAPVCSSLDTQLCPRAAGPGHSAVLMMGRGGAGVRADGVKVFTPARLRGRVLGTLASGAGPGPCGLRGQLAGTSHSSSGYCTWTQPEFSMCDPGLSPAWPPDQHPHPGGGVPLPRGEAPDLRDPGG